MTEMRRPIDAAARTPRGGVFITKGMVLSIPAGGLRISIGRDGSASSSVAMHVLLDVCPYWLQFALEHLHEAEDANAALLRAWETRDNAEAGKALEREFCAAVQAIVNTGISLDAFYARLKDVIDVPESLTRAWRRNKTARARQIAEAIRVAFKMRPQTANRIRDVVSKILDLRDLAVHPPGKPQEPLLHPELGVGVEWRFVAFGAPNAKEILRGALSLLVQLVKVPNEKYERLRKYCDELGRAIEPVCQAFEAQYGPVVAGGEQKVG